MQEILTNDFIEQLDCTHPYLLARKIAGLKRVDAATMLGVSERSLAYYEYSGKPIPDDVVLNMSRLYKSPWLRASHLNKNIIFKDIFGDIKFSATNEAMTVLFLQNKINEMERIMPDIIKNTLLNQNNNELIATCRETMTCLFAYLSIKEKPSARY